MTVKIDFESGFKPIAYFLTVNSYGVTNTGNFLNDRKSINSTTAPSLSNGYKTFLNPPDPTIWPNGTVPADPTFSVPAVSGCSPYLFNFNIAEAGDVSILLDLNGTVGYQQGTRDVLLEAFNLPVGANSITWNGKDGLGVPLINGEQLKFSLVYKKGRFNIPLYDAELNTNGVKASITQPVAIANSMMFWDDTQIVSIPTNTTGVGYANLAGMTSPAHAWDGSGNSTFAIPAPAAGGGSSTPTISTDDFGNDRLINTWGWGFTSSNVSKTLTFSTCMTCYKSPTDTSTLNKTNHGITALGRAGSDNGNWPMIRKSGYTAIESKTKGFVITRNSNPEGTINSPKEGMIVFDTDENGGKGCLKIYSEGVWSCFNNPTCDQ